MLSEWEHTFVKKSKPLNSFFCVDDYRHNCVSIPAERQTFDVDNIFLLQEGCGVCVSKNNLNVSDYRTIFHFLLNEIQSREDINVHT